MNKTLNCFRRLVFLPISFRDANWMPKLEIEIFPSRTQASQFEYFTGHGVQKISVASAHHGITIQFGDLGAGGNLEVYCKKVRGVTKDGKTLSEGPDYHYDSQTQKLIVPFTGAANFLIKGADGLFD